MIPALRITVAFALVALIAAVLLADWAMRLESAACRRDAALLGLVADWSVETGCTLAKHQERLARSPR